MRGLSKWMSGILVCLLLIGQLPLSCSLAMEGIDYNDLPRLLITEIAPNTINVDGADGYEYIEIYNNSNQNINLKDYKLLYDTGSKGYDWDISTDCTIGSKEVALAWITNTANEKLSVTDFVYYAEGKGVSIREEQVVRVPAPPVTVGGMSNTGPRTLRIFSDIGEFICEAFYSTSNGEDITLDYSYPVSGQVMVLANDSADASPGYVHPSQVPSKTVELPELDKPSTGKVPKLLITEICPDNAGDDHFEYFEVYNASKEDINLTEEGIKFYYYATNNVLLTYTENTVIKARKAAVFWLRYTSGNVDSFSKTEDDFKEFYKELSLNKETDYQLVEIIGQNGMANTGARGIRIADAQNDIIMDAYYPTRKAAPDCPIHFKLSTLSTDKMEILEEFGLPSPGYVSPEALNIQVGEEYQKLPALLVTELLPDSANVNGADAYEFIEIYNNSDKPINFKDYKIVYHYPDNGNETLWPSVPEDVLIFPGKTLVFWIINGANDDLTVDDFNGYFATNLIENQDIVKIFSAGMANSGARAVKIATNTMKVLSAAYYNMNGAKDTAVKQGIQYVYDLDNPTVQRLSGLESATPGTVSFEQKPIQPVYLLPDTEAPVIQIKTEPMITPGIDFDIKAEITDDSLVKTVVLYLKSDLQEEYTPYNVIQGSNGSYGRTIKSVDHIGKKYYDYYFTASDGNNIQVSPVQRTMVEGADQDSLRINLINGDIVKGEVAVTASGDIYPIEAHLIVNDQDVTAQSIPSLEKSAIFAFEATGVDTFFKNGVLIGSDILHIFDDGIYSGWETISTPVDIKYFIKGEELTISVYAGTKARPEIDLNENNDDFDICNIRLILPDGQELRPEGFSDPTTVIRMGDSVGKYDYIDCKFRLSDNSFKSLTYNWDTTTLPDGEYTISATEGSDQVKSMVRIDNTAPVISTNIEAKQYKGNFSIHASAEDAIAGVKKLQAFLDEEIITLPYETSSILLASGEHILKIIAEDHVGNKAVYEVAFDIPVEQPNRPILLTPDDGAEICEKDATLTAKVSDPTEDIMTVKFKEGYRFQPTDKAIKSYKGSTNDALDIGRDEKIALSIEQVQSINSTDGIQITESSKNTLPYYLFEIEIPAEAGEDYVANIVWEGSTNEGAKTNMYIYNCMDEKWDKIRQHVAENTESFVLEADVPSQGRVKDSKMLLLVQHSEGYAGKLWPPASTTPVTHPEDTPREDYDFTFAWESDTQYYNEDYYWHQINIHEYILDNLERMNIQYLFHTGDIVDEADKIQQWERADAAYKMLDEIGLPYGVLAGNHDVDHKTSDYTEYYKYFGEDRYNQNPWYGGSYKNNRGHYDLLSVDGIDFMMLYMGWGIGDEEIQWMNQVIKEYPERKVILNFHEYILTTGGLGEIPQRIYDEVVKVNANVCMVFSGHYHDAFTRIDAFDDDGDGVKDRKVYQILFDYQALAEGGLGYMRLMHFSLKDQKIINRTFSPSLQDYNAEDAMFEDHDQEFEIPFADLGLVQREKNLSTDSLQVNIYTDRVISTHENVSSGSNVSTIWKDAGRHGIGWYAEALDNFGGISRSEIRYLVNKHLTPQIPDDKDTPDDSDTPRDNNSSRGGSKGSRAPIIEESSLRAVDIQLDGKTENIGKITASKEGNQSIFMLDFDRKKLLEHVNSKEQKDLISVALNTKSEVVVCLLTGDVIKAMADRELALEIKTEIGTYKIPVGQIDIEAAADQLQVNGNLEAMKVQIKIAACSDDSVKGIEALSKKGGFVVVVPPVEFSIKGIFNSREVSISRFNTYVERTIHIPDGIDPKRITTGIVVESDGTIRHVPTKIIEIEGEYYVRIKSITNSIYAAIEHSVEFKDAINHWAKDAIHDMGARMIVSGINNDTFGPDRDITRAEFAAIVVKALGLKSKTGKSSFVDVKVTDWYQPFVETAYEYGIISGVGENRFAPMNKITREQAMTIIAKAMDITELKVDMRGSEVEMLLADFKDKDTISEYAKRNAAVCVKSQIISGRADNLLVPKNSITRAETVVLVKKLLEKSKLI